jgi:hypothetical protein
MTPLNVLYPSPMQDVSIPGRTCRLVEAYTQPVESAFRFRDGLPGGLLHRRLYYYWGDNQEMHAQKDDLIELTAKQKSLLPAYRDKWIKIGLSTEPCDFERAKEAAARAYRAAGLTPPRKWALADSPMHSAHMYCEMAGLPPTKPNLADDLNNQSYGSHDAGWLSFYDFFLTVVGLEVCEPLRPTIDLAQVCGRWSPYEEACILQHRHNILRLDDLNRLHCVDGPACAYPDGTAVYAIHGVAIPEKWVTGSPPTPHQALTWENIEQRRAACELLGWESIVAQLRPKIIDTDEDPQIGELLRVRLPDADGPHQFLRVRCGTGRWFCIPVPAECRTAREANAATYGISADELHPEIRT